MRAQGKREDDDEEVATSVTRTVSLYLWILSDTIIHNKERCLLIAPLEDSLFSSLPSLWSAIEIIPDETVMKNP